MMTPAARLSATLVACALGSTVVAQDYVVTELTVLDGGLWSRAYGVNVHGHVVGMSRLANSDEHAVLWKDGELIDLGTLGASPSVARDINDVGEIVGQSRTKEGPWRGFRYRNGAMVEIGVLPFEDCSTAHAINNQGVLVGASGCGGAEPIIQHTDDERLEPLSPVGVAAQARDVNTSNTAVWLRSATVDGETVDLEGFDAEGFEVYEAYGVNDDNLATGIARLDEYNGELFRTFIYDLETGVLTTLPTHGTGESGGRAIDSAGRVVGYTWVRNPGSTVPGVLWDDGIWYDLNDMIDPDAGWFLGRAEDISEAGHIVGFGTHDEENRGYVLTPRDPADFDADGSVDLDDLLRLLADWGACEDCPTDVNGDGEVNFADLLLLLGAWGRYAGG